MSKKLDDVKIAGHHKFLSQHNAARDTNIPPNISPIDLAKVKLLQDGHNGIDWSILAPKDPFRQENVTSGNVYVVYLFVFALLFLLISGECGCT